MPKISVLMPVYKTPEKYLREAIESILGQTFKDFELLILDDDCPQDSKS
jgi:glycosyltransferase involved in cell wall biosynthesis